MMGVFLDRVQGQVEQVKAELERTKEPQEVLGMEHCLALDCSEGDLDARVVVLNPSVFQREYRNAPSQLVYITDGFGMFANTRDSTIYGHNVFSGKTTKLCRQFIFGVLDPAKAPDWVKPGMAAIHAQLRGKGGRPRER
jgi:hypothetical protein